jgi:hypothetical protein
MNELKYTHTYPKEMFTRQKHVLADNRWVLDVET